MWGNQLSSMQNSAQKNKTGLLLTGKLNILLLVVFGVGGLLLLAQVAWQFLVNDGPLVVPAQEQPVPAEGVTLPNPPPEVASTNNDSFLPEYDASSASLLADDDRPLWQVTADLGIKLAFVIGLIYVVVAVLRWLQRHKLNSPGIGTAIHVLETTGLAPGRTLHLVEVGDKTLLIGATDHQLTLLTELTPPPPEPPSQYRPLSETEIEMPAVDLAPDPVPNPIPLNHLEKMYQQAEPAAEFNQSLDWQLKVGDLRQSMRRIRETQVENENIGPAGFPDYE